MAAKMLQGDCLDVLKTIKDNSIALAYIDPPFNTGKTWVGPCGSFTDIFSSNDAYIEYMTERVTEIRRVLAPNGALYLHCDYRMTHHLRLMLDGVMGENCFKNEIIWSYKSWSINTRAFQKNHDNILFYVKNENDYIWNKQLGPLSSSQTEAIKRGYNKGTKNGVKLLRIYNKDNAKVKRLLLSADKDNRRVYYVNMPEGLPMRDVWDIPYVGSVAKERAGYPTQKPVKLLERIIKTSSNEGDWVIDCFCGSGTTGVVSMSLGRNFIGVDVSTDAVAVSNKRMGLLG